MSVEVLVSELCIFPTLRRRSLLFSCGQALWRVLCPEDAEAEAVCGRSLLPHPGDLRGRAEVQRWDHRRGNWRHRWQQILRVFFHYLSVKVICLFELSFMHDLVRLVLWHTVGRYLKAVLRSRSRWSRNYLRPRAGAEAAWSRNYLIDKYLVQTVWNMLGWRKTNFYLYWYSTTTTVIEQF